MQRRPPLLLKRLMMSSSEQASGIDQVTQAVQQLEHVIQQSTIATDKMASTSGELAGQAERLKETAAFFKMKGRGFE